MQLAEEERLAKLREAKADAIEGKQAAGTAKDNQDTHTTQNLSDEDYFAQRVAEAAKIAQRLKEEEQMEEEDKIVVYLGRLLKEWGEELASDETIVRSADGKQAIATYKQTDRYLEPLLEQLKTSTIHPHVFRVRILCSFL